MANRHVSQFTCIMMHVFIATIIRASSLTDGRRYDILHDANMISISFYFSCILRQVLHNELYICFFFIVWLDVKQWLTMAQLLCHVPLHRDRGAMYAENVHSIPCNVTWPGRIKDVEQRSD